MSNMASMKASFLCFGVVLLSFSLAHSLELLVGGKDGSWKIPASPKEAPNRWAFKLRFRVNDTLVFKYNPNEDSVLEVSKRDYKDCETSDPITAHRDGNTKIKLPKSGHYYFISGEKGHCEKGQKLLAVARKHRRGIPNAPSPNNADAPAPPPNNADAPAPPPNNADAPAPPPNNADAPAPPPEDDDNDKAAPPPKVEDDGRIPKAPQPAPPPYDDFEIPDEGEAPSPGVTRNSHKPTRTPPTKKGKRSPQSPAPSPSDDDQISTLEAPLSPKGAVAPSSARTLRNSQNNSKKAPAKRGKRVAAPPADNDGVAPSPNNDKEAAPSPNVGDFDFPSEASAPSPDGFQPAAAPGPSGDDNGVPVQPPSPSDDDEDWEDFFGTDVPELAPSPGVTGNNHKPKRNIPPTKAGKKAPQSPAPSPTDDDDDQIVTLEAPLSPKGAVAPSPARTRRNRRNTSKKALAKGSKRVAAPPADDDGVAPSPNDYGAAPSLDFGDFDLPGEASAPSPDGFQPAAAPGPSSYDNGVPVQAPSPSDDDEDWDEFFGPDGPAAAPSPGDYNDDYMFAFTL